MRLLRLLWKLILLVVISLQWVLTFLNTFSGILLHILSGIVFLIAVLGVLFGVCTPAETIRTLAIGFGIYLVPVLGEWSVHSIIRVRIAITSFIQS